MRNPKLHPYQNTPYSVTKCGKVFRNGRQLTPVDDGLGYLKLVLSINGIRMNKYVHIMIAETFHPNPEQLPIVNHKNGKPSDCRRVNLEWASVSQNNKHAYDTGLNKGRRNVKAKVRCPDNIIYKTVKAAADKFGVDRKTIRRWCGNPNKIGWVQLA